MCQSDLGDPHSVFPPSNNIPVIPQPGPIPVSLSGALNGLQKLSGGQPKVLLHGRPELRTHLGFASVTTEATALLASWCPSVVSRERTQSTASSSWPVNAQRRYLLFLITSFTASVHQWVLWLLPRQAPPPPPPGDQLSSSCHSSVILPHFPHRH